MTVARLEPRLDPRAGGDFNIRDDEGYLIGRATWSGAFEGPIHWRGLDLAGRQIGGYHESAEDAAQAVLDAHRKRKDAPE
jgi:hypothetical protein